MIKYFIFVVTIFLVNACTTLSDLTPPKEVVYFDVNSNVERMDQYSLRNFERLFLIKKGRYTAVAEDDSGIYFIGSSSDSVLIVPDYDFGNIDKFRKSTDLKSVITFPRTGIWLPKDPNKEPRLFCEEGVSSSQPYKVINNSEPIDNLTGYNIGSNAASSAGVSNEVGGAIGAATVAAISAAIYGKIEFVDLPNPDFLKEVIIKKVETLD